MVTLRRSYCETQGFLDLLKMSPFKVCNRLQKLNWTTTEKLYEIHNMNIGCNYHLQPNFTVQISQIIRMISEGSCDLSNDAKNSALKLHFTIYLNEKQLF